MKQKLYAFQISLVMHAVASESAWVLAVGTVEVRESSTRNAEMIVDYSRTQTYAGVAFNCTIAAALADCQEIHATAIFSWRITDDGAETVKSARDVMSMNMFAV